MAVCSTWWEACTYSLQLSKGACTYSLQGIAHTAKPADESDVSVSSADVEQFVMGHVKVMLGMNSVMIFVDGLLNVTGVIQRSFGFEQ